MANYNWGRIVTKKYTIGGVGVAGCDFNFVTAANQTEQPINLGAIIPIGARVIDVYAITNTQFTGAVSLGITLGATTGATTYSTTVNVYAANAVVGMLHANGFSVLPNAAAATNIWVNGTPGANWSLATAGKLSVYVTYLDNTLL
jgi:hypothetical protein